MSSEDFIAKQRGELAGLTGPVRTGGLVRLGQALFERYWRVGPGQPAALPVLNEAIVVFGEASGYLRVTDPMRGFVSALRGWLLGARHSAHTGDELDRETGIQVLIEALTFPTLPPTLVAMNRIMLGQLYLSRALLAFNAGGSPLNAILGGAASGSAADADRAIAILREIVSGPTVSDQLTDAANTLLTVAQAVRSLSSGLGTGPASVNLGALRETLSALERLQQAGLAGANGPAGSNLVLPPLTSIFDAEAMAAGDAMDYPVAVLRDTGSSVRPPRPIQRPSAHPIDASELRRRLHASIRALGDHPDPAVSVWAIGAVLLGPKRPAPATDVVDDLVALAGLLVDVSTSDAPVARGVDRFLLAVALFLRSRVDATGAAADLRAGAENLLTAADLIPPTHSVAVTVLVSLGAFLDERIPLSGPFEAIAGPYADRIDAVMAAGAVSSGADLATLHALRCLGRAATGQDDGLVRAVGTVPLEYPWLGALRAAAGAFAASSIGRAQWTDGPAPAAG